MGIFRKSVQDFCYFTRIDGRIFKDGDERFLSGAGTDNGGKPISDALVERLISVKPSYKQLKYLELEYYNFIHFGMNTFTGKEWGTGREKESLFNPTALNTDNWCEILKASGSKGVILTAKHHDGFCLWQTDTTEHSIKNSPYKGGKGDIVKELSESCKKYGMKFGVYLSPWDMNSKYYGKPEYNDFFCEQLTELLTRYGEVFSVWFDGARGKNAVNFEYDYDRYYRVVKELQPDAVTCVQGEDVRWVGNEAGVARESEWSVISKGHSASDEFQNDEKDAARLLDVRFDDSDVGSRELLQKYRDLAFMPAEVDVSIRRGWFYHKRQKPKPVEQLLKIYYKSVGGNSSLLLNVPPDKRGLISDADAEVLRKFGEKLKKDTESKIIPVKTVISGANSERISDMNGSAAADSPLKLKDGEYILDFYFESKRKIARIDLREDLRFSQRVERFDAYLKVDGDWLLLAEANNVGNRRIICFDADKAIAAEAVRIVIRQSRSNAVLKSVDFYGVL